MLENDNLRNMDQLNFILRRLLIDMLSYDVYNINPNFVVKANRGT